jgi:hypothetical protein
VTTKTYLNVRPALMLSAIELEDAKFDNYPNGAYFVYNPVNGGNCSLGATNPCGLVPGAPGAPPGYNGTTWNLGGNKLPNAPPFSFSISAKYELPTSSGTWDYNVALNHTGDYYFEPDNGQGQISPSSPNNDRQPIVNLLNASIGWTSLNERLAVRAWGMNLAGQRYYSYNAEDADASQYSAAPPRTYGITFTEHFGGGDRPR